MDQSRPLQRIAIHDQAVARVDLTDATGLAAAGNQLAIHDHCGTTRIRQIGTPLCRGLRADAVAAGKRVFPDEHEMVIALDVGAARAA
jgi:hypothetical protein